MGDLNEDQLRALYAWIDAVPLSRPKRNIGRDFSDGVLFAEIVHAYFPQLVELHNFTPANSVKQKVYNFETLNQKVLRKLGYVLTRPIIDDIVNCKAGTVESVLNTLQFKMAKYRERKASAPETSFSPPSQQQQQQAGPSAAGGKFSGFPSVNDEILVEKEQQIRELHETVEILELKIAKLEQLVRLKDNKIQKLLQR